MIEQHIADLLGSARLETISRLEDEEWIAIVSFDGAVFRGTGSTIDDALTMAVTDGKPVGNKYGIRFNGEPEKPKKKPVQRNLLVQLGMYRPQVTRR